MPRIKENGTTRAQRQRAIRQEALREQLAAQGHINHVVDMVDKIRDSRKKVSPEMLDRYKVAINTKLKLINKYLPDVKQVEIQDAPNVGEMTDAELDAAIAALESGAEG